MMVVYCKLTTTNYTYVGIFLFYSITITWSNVECVNTGDVIKESIIVQKLSYVQNKCLTFDNLYLGNIIY